MKRREFIGIATVGAVGAVLPAPSRGADSRVTALAHPRLIEILGDERVVRDLGRRYRETVPSEDHPDTLAPLILGIPLSEQHAPIETNLSEVKLRTRLDDRVQRDFEAGRTVTLDGWILSMTEARQCALLSLLPA